MGEIRWLLDDFQNPIMICSWMKFGADSIRTEISLRWHKRKAPLSLAIIRTSIIVINGCDKYRTYNKAVHLDCIEIEWRAVN